MAKPKEKEASKSTQSSARKKADKKRTNKKTEKTSKKSSKDTKKVCEVFEVDKKGKEKEVKACGDLKVEHASKKDLQKQNSILTWFFVVVGIIFILILSGIYYANSSINFEYRGVEFKKIQEGEITAYETEFPYYNEQNKIIPYYVYVRNDPRILHNQVPFKGKMDFGDVFNVDGKRRLYVEMDGDFYCDKKGILAQGNMYNLEALGINYIRVANETCDEEGRYMFLKIVSGDRTEINQIGESCYELTVNNCEILKGTERFMTEAFVYYYEHLDQ